MTSSDLATGERTELTRQHAGSDPRRRRRLSTRSDGIGYLFLLPTMASLAIFTLYPMLDTLWLGFTNSNGVSGSFVGLSNYRYVLTDSEFWGAVYNTVYIGVLTIAIGVPLSLVVASLINSLPAFRSLFKAVYFAPNVTSAIASAIAFLYVFYPSSDGWVNAALGVFGVQPQTWFADPNLSRLGLVAMSVWHGLGYLILIWLAGLQAIPRTLQEQAAVDGAGWARRWWHITVPGLRPITFFIIVIETINAFKRFADAYQIGGPDGQPGGTLTTILVYIYRTGFNTFDFGRASAASLITFIMIIALTLINFRFFGRGD